MMGEVARRYPAGALAVSTGSYTGSAEFDAAFPHPVDRMPIESRRLRAVHGWVPWCRRAAVLARAIRPELIWCGNLKPAAYPANWVTRSLGIPHGVFLHGTSSSSSATGCALSPSGGPAAGCSVRPPCSWR